MEPESNSGTNQARLSQVVCAANTCGFSRVSARIGDYRFHQLGKNSWLAMNLGEVNDLNLQTMAEAGTGRSDMSQRGIVHSLCAVRRPWDIRIQFGPGERSS